MFHSHLDHFQNPPLGGRSNTRPGDHGTPNAHNRWFILFYHVRGPTWIDIHWNNIRLRALSHMTSHYTWGSVTTLLHDCGGVLGWPLDTFCWALTMSWPWLLALECEVCGCNKIRQSPSQVSTTYDFTLHLRVRGHTTTWLWRWVGMTFIHFLLGSHNFHGHGSWLLSVKWPLVWLQQNRAKSMASKKYHIWLHTTLEGPWPRTTTWLWRCIGTAFRYYLLGSHNFHGHGSWLSSMKWPLVVVATKLGKVHGK